MENISFNLLKVWMLQNQLLPSIQKALQSV